MDALLALVARIWLVAVLLTAMLFPGVLLAILVMPADASELMSTCIGLAGASVSYFFWQGVRSNDTGRRLTDWAIGLGVRD